MSFKEVSVQFANVHRVEPDAWSLITNIMVDLAARLEALSAPSRAISGWLVSTRMVGSFEEPQTILTVHPQYVTLEKNELPLDAKSEPELSVSELANPRSDTPKESKMSYEYGYNRFSEDDRVEVLIGEDILTGRVEGWPADAVPKWGVPVEFDSEPGYVSIINERFVERGD